jgi:hypothetical protein
MRRICLVLLILVGTLDAHNLYDPEHSRVFAEYLLKSGQYNLASIEFERLQFLEPENDSLKASLIRSYTLGLSHDMAIRSIHRIFPDKSTLSQPFSSLFVYNLIASGNQQEALRFLREPGLFNPDQYKWFSGFALLSKLDFKSTAALFREGEELPATLIKVKAIATEGVSTRLKKPWLAGTMSGLVPGSGKLYTGDWKDALISMVTIGLTGFQAYRGFSRNGITSTYGWIYAGLGTGFYLGNIYGAVASAKRVNRRTLERLKAKIDDTFYLRP